MMQRPVPPGPNIQMPVPIFRPLVKKFFRFLVSVLAIAYFLLDTIFLSLVRPAAHWLGTRPLAFKLLHATESLGPYPTLGLFLTPIIFLEPIKPLGFYLLAEGHIISAVLLLSVGELLKVTIVEGLYHHNQEKLRTIPWFCWVLDTAGSWIQYIKALVVYRAVENMVKKTKKYLGDFFQKFRQDYV